MSTFELVSLVASVITTVFSAMLGAIVWLMKHAANVERELLRKAIDEAKIEAKRATDALTKEIELRHTQDLKLTQHDGKFLAVAADVERLESRDDAQEQQILRLKERLDRGARTRSDQSPAVREPDSDPPPVPPMRPRFPSVKRGPGE